MKNRLSHWLGCGATLVASIVFATVAPAAEIRGAAPSAQESGRLLTDGAPQIAVQPQSVAAIFYTWVSFSVTATGDGPISYQWQQRAPGGSWTDLAEGPYYQVASSVVGFFAQPSDDGQRYRCLVTNTSGTTASAEATLTVANAAFTKLALGQYHGLRVDFAGEAYSVGTNADGQLALGSTELKSLPEFFSSGVVAVAAAGRHTLALRQSGALYAAGLNSSGQLGDGTTNSQSSLGYMAGDVVAMAAGLAHSVYLKSDGTLWAVGANASGQLGDGTTTGRLSPVQVAAGVVDVAAGAQHTLFLKTDRSLWRVGNGTGEGTFELTPQQIATDVVRIASGGYHQLYTKSDGSLWGLGSNSFGQLGGNAPAVVTEPVQITTGVKSIAGGYTHTVFIKEDGTLWALGSNQSGQLGDGTTTSRGAPVQLASEVALVSAGEGCTLFVKLDGSLWGTGSNAAGQFGLADFAGTLTPVQIQRGVMQPPPEPIYNLKTVAMADTGVQLRWTPALDASSYEVWRGSTDEVTQATRIASDVPWAVFSDPTPLSGLSYYWVRAVNSAGTGGFSETVQWSISPMVIRQPATMSTREGDFFVFWVEAVGVGTLSYQWRKDGVDIPGATAFEYTGYAQQAQSGVYTVVVSNASGSVESEPASLTVLVPPSVTVQPQAQSVLLGGTAVFSTTISGTAPLVYQWERQSHESSGFLAVNDDAVYAGATTASLTVKADKVGFAGGLYRCRVSNASGQVTTTAARLFMRTEAGALIAGAAGFRSTTLHADGTLWGFGRLPLELPEAGQTAERSVPVQMAVDVVASSFNSNYASNANGGHQFVLKADGTLWATGNNSEGQLGDGTRISRTTFVQVVEDVVSAVAGEGRSFFIKNDGTLWGAGASGEGYLSETPAQKLIARNVREVAAGGSHLLVLHSDGSLWGSGSGTYGQLGLGTVSPSSSELVTIASGVAQIAAGESHSLFLKNDGTLWGMGSNHAGALGLGHNAAAVYVPMPIATDVVFAAAGSHRSFFIKSNGDLYAMGDNQSGALGDGTTVARNLPIKVAEGVVSVASGALHTVFVKSDGSAWSMGSGTIGQLGDGSLITARSTPVLISTGTLSAPAVPSGLTASDATTYTGVHIMWQPVIGAQFYEIYRGTTDDSGSATKLAARIAPAYWEDTTATPGVAYRYWVRAVNAAGTSAFGPAEGGTRAIAVVPAIVTPPVGQTVTLDAQRSASFSVVATGTGPLVYQWKRDGIALTDSFYVQGARTPALSLTDLNWTEGGKISVVVSNPGGSVESAPVDLLVGYPPTIYQQPQSLTVNEGESASFTVVAHSGSAIVPPNYVWRKDGEVIPNANSATLTLDPVARHAAGVYSVELINPYGSVTSNPVNLTVVPLPVTLTSWRVLYFSGSELSQPQISGPNADPDGDGLSNLLEYALGFEPKTATTSGVPEVAATASEWTYTYTRPSDRSDVTYAVEASTNLTTWTTTNVTHELVSTDAVAGTETWRARYPLGSATNAFFRLKVSLP